MRTKWRSTVARILVAAFIFLPIHSIAADFELYWDPNCNDDPDLEGYYIYYKYYEPGAGIFGQSGSTDTSQLDDVYIPLSDPEFDPYHPSCLIEGLQDDVRYCFTVTAWYGDEESDTSNEVCGVNGTYESDDYSDGYSPGYMIPEDDSTSIYTDSDETMAEDGVFTNNSDWNSGTMWRHNKKVRGSRSRALP